MEKVKRGSLAGFAGPAPFHEVVNVFRALWRLGQVHRRAVLLEELTGVLDDLLIGEP